MADSGTVMRYDEQKGHDVSMQGQDEVNLTCWLFTSNPLFLDILVQIVAPAAATKPITATMTAAGSASAQTETNPGALVPWILTLNSIVTCTVGSAKPVNLIKSKGKPPKPGNPVRPEQRARQSTSPSSRRSWDAGTKSRIVVEIILNHPERNLKAIARKHGLTPKQLREWWKAELELNKSNPMRKRLGTPGRRPKLIDIEKDLAFWLRQRAASEAPEDRSAAGASCGPSRRTKFPTFTGRSSGSSNSFGDGPSASQQYASGRLTALWVT